MINSILVDDEYRLIKVLRNKLEKFCPQIDVVGEAESIDDAIKLLHSHKIELVFLDISMNGESGFDLLKKIDKIDFEIIFVTGFSEFALDALKISAVDYILKPIQNEELRLAVEKAALKITNKKELENLSILKYNLQHLGSENARIAISSSNSCKFIKVKELIRFEGWEKYTRIYLASGDVITSSYNVGVFKSLVKSYSFFQTHRSHIVNESHIVEFNPEGTVVMSNGDQVPVSRRNREDFLNKFVRNSIK